MFTTQTNILPNKDPNARQLSDDLDFLSYGNNILNNGLNSLEKEAGNFVDQNLQNILGTSQSRSQELPMPTQQSYEAMMNQQKMAANSTNPIVDKAKRVNPIIYGLLGMGVSKLAGLGWLTSVGIGAGVGGGKYFLIDKK